ncbi:g10768 [Coccomyxa viridis]|uniref:G10768 protein n=1 Tax=Coccomyxa viridis TaxID=1274662 RepID=A0ABP1G681_9CHLO
MDAAAPVLELVVRGPGYPADFCYSANSTPDHSSVLIEDVEGCPCSSRYGCRVECPCSCSKTPGALLEYLGPGTDEDTIPALTECGPACVCPASCRNRICQQGLKHRVELCKDKRKGWSARAAEPIKQGSFVCQYAGELLTSAVAAARLAEYDAQAADSPGHALMVVREWLPSRNACLRINVDATRTSNVAHFFSHSCDGGNLLIVLVRLRGSPIPLLGMFARRDISAGEELTFCYGEDSPDSLPMSGKGPVRTRRPCFCGSRQCTGVLPASPV